MYVSAVISLSLSLEKQTRLRGIITRIATCTVVEGKEHEGKGTRYFWGGQRVLRCHAVRFEWLVSREELSGNSVIFKTASGLPIFAKRVYRLPLIRRAILRRRISSRPFVNG